MPHLVGEQAMSDATCRGCGRRIVWGMTVDGKKIPLDPTPAIYQFIDDGSMGPTVQRAVPNTFMVSHFSTCSQANKFSGRNRA